MLKHLLIVCLFSEDGNSTTSHTQNSNISQISMDYLQYRERPVREQSRLYQKQCYEVNALEFSVFMQRASLGSLHHGHHSVALLGRSHCLRTTDGETRPERAHSSQRVNGRVRIQSPFFIKFSKWGREVENFRADNQRGDQKEKKQTQQWRKLI